MENTIKYCVTQEKFEHVRCDDLLAAVLEMSRALRSQNMQYCNEFEKAINEKMVQKMVQLPDAHNRIPFQACLSL